MLVLSVLLFWMPILGPLIAGFVGGRKSGSVGNAILAALLPGTRSLAHWHSCSLHCSTQGRFSDLWLGWASTGLALAHVGPMLVAAVVGAGIRALKDHLGIKNRKSSKTRNRR